MKGVDLMPKYDSFDLDIQNVKVEKPEGYKPSDACVYTDMCTYTCASKRICQE